MDNNITCPYCKKSFEPTEAYKHELEEKLLREEQLKHQKEIEVLKNENKKLEEVNKEEVEKIKKEAFEKARQEAQENTNKELKDRDEQIIKLKTRAEQAEAQELEIRKEKRELEESKRKFELEKERQLDKERGEIRDKAIKEAQEKQELKNKEKDLVIDGLRKSLAEAQRKAQQGSQQTQGEALELTIEEILRQKFPQDTIDEVKKGQRGADIIQKVTDKKGQTAGTILWESKNANWQSAWVKKLKEDQRQAKADLVILVSNNLPDDIKDFCYRDGVWILSRNMIIPIAFTLRFDLIRINFERGINTNKDKKMEVLYQYMTSMEFKHRIEAIVESFGEMQELMEKEKRFFSAKWANQEKSLRKIIDHTYGMYGEIQSVAGKSLPEIETLKLEAENK